MPLALLYANKSGFSTPVKKITGEVRKPRVNSAHFAAHKNESQAWEEPRAATIGNIMISGGTDSSREKVYIYRRFRPGLTPESPNAG
jgi:hypothetical protein